MQRPWGRTVSSMLEEQLEPSEEREEGKAGGSGPCGPWENLGFYLRAGGEPGELWTEEGLGFAQVFTGALWWLLLGGQTGGRRDCFSRKEGVGGCWGPTWAEAMRGNFQGL